MTENEIVTAWIGSCPSCGGTEFVKAGMKRLSGRVVQRLQCKKCGRYVTVEVRGGVRE